MMKALIRNPGETVIENGGIIGIDWNTGAPLTNPAWAGGPYRLVMGYVGEPEDEGETAPAESKETVTIDGKEYTKEELLAMLNQTA